MDSDVGLLDYRARTTDPETSHDAAEQVNVFGEFEVLKAIKTFGESGCISDEVQEYFGYGKNDMVSYSGITARFIKLERKCYIERTGEVRKSRFNRNQLVMRALSDEDRTARLQLQRRLMATVLTPEEMQLVVDWWRAETAALEAEKARREKEKVVLDRIFKDVPFGKSFVPLHGLDGTPSHKLIANRTPRSCTLSFAEFSTRDEDLVEEARLLEEMTMRHEL